MMKNNKIFTWIRNIILIPMVASMTWLAFKAHRLLSLYNSTMLEGGSGVKLAPFTNTDKYILIVLVISLILFLIFNKIRKNTLVNV